MTSDSVDVLSGHGSTPGEPLVFWRSDGSYKSIVVMICFEKRKVPSPQSVRIEYVDQGEKCMLRCYSDTRFSIETNCVMVFFEGSVPTETRAVLSFTDLKEASQ